MIALVLQKCYKQVELPYKWESLWVTQWIIVSRVFILGRRPHHTRIILWAMTPNSLELCRVHSSPHTEINSPVSAAHSWSCLCLGFSSKWVQCHLMDIVAIIKYLKWFIFNFNYNGLDRSKEIVWIVLLKGKLHIY